MNLSWYLCRASYACAVSIFTAQAATISSASALTRDRTGGNECSQTSAGAAVSCESVFPGEPVADAQAMASSSAAFGNVSANAAAGLNAAASASMGIARAEGAAGFDGLISIPGLLNGVVTGHWVAVIGVRADANALAFVSQGGTPLLTVFTSQMISIPATILNGAPFSVSGSVQASASPLFSSDANAELRLLGFTDAAGDDVAFQVVPEPASGALAGLMLLLAAARYNANRHAKHFP